MSIGYSSNATSDVPDTPTCACGHPQDEHSEVLGCEHQTGSGGPETFDCDCLTYLEPDENDRLLQEQCDRAEYQLDAMESDAVEEGLR